MTKGNSSGPEILKLLNEFQMGNLARTGERFFESMVSELSRALSADIIMIGEINSDNNVHCLAFCENGEIAPNFTYNLKGTASEKAISQNFYSKVEAVAQSFPSDTFLSNAAIEGFIGIPLY